MKVTCNRALLTTAFQTVAGVVPTRTTKPVLQNVKFSAAAEGAVLMGTDQEVGVRVKIGEADVQEPGELLLPTARTLAILREIQGEAVRLESGHEEIWLRGDRAEYRLAYVDPAEFPDVSEFTATSFYTVPTALLKQLIRRTLFATDIESTRYALGGVLVDIRDDGLVLAATDTRRLAVARGQCAATGDVKIDNAWPVVPQKAMSLIERSLADSADPVCLALRNNDVLVKSGGTTIYARLLEGRFPRYQDVIPRDCQVRIDLIAASFHAAVRQAQIVTSDESRGVDFSFAPGLLTLLSQDVKIGQSRVELPISYDGAPIAITFDPRYVSDFLKVLDAEQQVILELTDPESAAVLRTDDGYTYIIMPLSKDR